MMIVFSWVFAVDVMDTQIIDELTKRQQQEQLQQAELLTENFTFDQVNSCENMEQVFTDFLEMYKKYNPQRPYYYRNGRNDIVMEAVSAKSMDMADGIQATVSEAPAMGGGGDFSTTNLQKV